jgi:hypothetical protein
MGERRGCEVAVEDGGVFVGSGQGSYGGGSGLARSGVVAEGAGVDVKNVHQ